LSSPARLVIAHRGHKVAAPEQTLAAYRLAIDLGATMIEADLRFTRDGVPVMLHDRLLDRTTSGRGPVAAMDWAEVANLDAGSWFDERFRAERVPRLDDLFALAVARGTALCIEAKGEAGDNARAALFAAHEIAWRGRLDIDVVASFDHRGPGGRRRGLGLAPGRSRGSAAGLAQRRHRAHGRRRGGDRRGDRRQRRLTAAGGTARS
jgi:glycerophosphoryl diester phosphodiesterase